WRIDKTGQGILAFITNHTYLDNPAFCGMRQSLINTFDEIYLLDLHGNIRKREVCPDGSKDENVFDIQQGVAIGIFVKQTGMGNIGKVYHADIWGRREAKYKTLSEIDITDIQWVELNPNSPLYLCAPRKEEFRVEYERCWKVNNVFPMNSDGVKTHRDHFVVDFEESALKERMLVFTGTTMSDDDIGDRFGLTEKEGWSVADARDSVRKDKDWDIRFRKYLYRPFDVRYIFYHEAVIERARSNIMGHMLKGRNLAICVGRAGQVIGPETWNIIFCSNSIEDCNLFYRGGTVNLPLYLYPAEKKEQVDKSGGKEGGIANALMKEEREPNLTPAFVKDFAEKLALKFVQDGKGDFTETFGPEDVFHYAYAIFHSPTYRTRYAEFLKTDFPRLPLTSDKKLFEVLAEKGAELVSLHLLESPTLNNLITKYPVSGSNTVDKVTYDDNNRRVFINKEQYFDGVPPEVWEFHVGGYQVCQKWLKDRKGRTLTYDELTHYQKVVVALKETTRLMAEIDALIPGWPIE
ncbi:MAG: type ISP restriction/modification enzyme, partial [Dehalococcoidales bacterium]|nr:type ISP restriction/modification enzyme [Dehalococcoidales bacterium]